MALGKKSAEKDAFHAALVEAFRVAQHYNLIAVLREILR
jgi:hypothetical protein